LINTRQNFLSSKSLKFFGSIWLAYITEIKILAYQLIFKNELIFLLKKVIDTDYTQDCELPACYVSNNYTPKKTNI